MKKRLVAFLLMGVMAMSMLTGCGSSEEVATEDPAVEETGEAEKSTGEVVEISFWDQNPEPARTAAYEKMIADFEAENPDVKVKLVSVPADQAKAKYDVAIQSGTAPDCGGVSQYWMSDFLVQDALVALDDYIANWDDKDNTLEEFDNSIRSMAPDGKMYGLAHMVTIPAIWYNTNMLADAGCEVPTDYDSLFEAVEKMTDKENGQYGFSIRGGAGNSQQLEQMMYQYSGISEMFDENGQSTVNAPEHVEFVEKFASLYNVCTAESDVTNGYTEMVAAFDSGAAGMIFHNLGSYGTHAGTLGEGNFDGIVRLNAVNGKQIIASNGAMCLAVFKDSEHPEEAFRFISYLVEHEASSYLNELLGQIPCNKEALEDSWIQERPAIKEAAEALLDSNTSVTTLPINVIGYYDLHSNVLVEGFQNVLLGNMTAQEYLDNWAAEMTNLKAEYDAYLESLE